MFGAVFGLAVALAPVDSTRIDSLQTIEIQSSSAMGMGRSALDLGSGTQVSAKVLRQIQAVNPNELVATVPGLMARDEDGFGLRMNWGIRGTGTERSSRIVLMEDGVLTAPAAYSAPAAYYQPSVLRMAGIDVVKGSSQIAAGPQTTGGAINFISSATDLRQQVKFRAAIGSYGTRFAHSQVSMGGPKRASSVEWLRQHSEGFRQLDGGGSTGFDLNELVLKSQFRLSSRQTLLVKAVGKVEESAQSYLGLTESDFALNPYRQYALSQKDLMKSQFGQAWLRHLWTGRRSELSTTAYVQYFGRNWYKLDALEADGGTNVSISSLLNNPSVAQYALLVLDSAAEGRAEIKANNRSYGARGIQTHGRHSLGRQAELRFGARLHQDFGDQYQWSDWFRAVDGNLQLEDRGARGSAGNQRLTSTAGSAYAEATLRRGKWTAVPGVRVESIFSRNQRWSASDSLRTSDATVNAAWTTVALPGLRVQRQGDRVLWFASVHRGFASGSANPDVRAEQSVNSELGMQLRRGRVSGTATAFATYYHNMLGSDLAASGGGGTGELFNAGAARVLGLELAGTLVHPTGRIAWEHHLQGTLVHSAFTEAFKASTDVWRDVAVGDPIPYTPAVQTNLRSEARLGRWGMVANLHYVGSSATGRGADLPQRTLLHGGIFVQPTSKWRIQLDGSNLTGAKTVASLHPAGWRVVGPRMIRLGVSYGW